MDISSVSNFDYINIIGHYNKITEVKKTDPRLLTRGYTEEQIKAMQNHSRSAIHEVISMNLHFKCNLDQFDYPLFNYVLTLWEAYDTHGVLPFEGSLVDQPAYILEVFQILTSLKIEREKKLYDEQRREQEKKSRQRKGK